MDHDRLKGRFCLSLIFISSKNQSAKPLREKVSRALNIVKIDKSNSFTKPLDLWNVTINLIKRQAWSQLKANTENISFFFICSMALHYYIYWESWLIPTHLLCGSDPFSSLIASRPQSATVQTKQLTATSLSQKHRILTKFFHINTSTHTETHIQIYLCFSVMDCMTNLKERELSFFLQTRWVKVLSNKFKYGRKAVATGHWGWVMK